MYKYKDTIIDEKIYNKTWYSYNTINGYYDIFEINENSITYKEADSLNDYTLCNKYNYNKKNKSFELNCEKEFIIDDINDNRLVLIINEKKKVFYTNINDTLNNEFNAYFSKSISEFKNDMSRVKELIKINDTEIKSLFIQEENSKFVFIGNKCTSIECSISLDMIEKWITNTENIYYIDSTNMNVNNLNELNTLENKFITDINYYNSIYPLVLITNNGNIIDSYYIKCNGFNCEKYENNEF